MRAGSVRELFHGMPQPPDGVALKPGTKYGSEIGPRARQQLGLTPDAHPPLVFATPHLQHAAAFASNGMANAMVYGEYRAGHYFAIFCERDTFLKAALSGVVYAFPADGFVKLEHSTNHYVSLAEVPFARTRRPVEVKSVRDLMQAGVQVFTVREPKPKPGEPWPYGGFHESSIPKDLGPYIDRSQVFWENYESGLNPDAHLVGLFGMAPPSETAHPRTFGPRSR